jgi:nucleotide-binding universal stress UspA family protein
VKYGAALHLVHVISHPVTLKGLEEFARVERVDAIELAGIDESILAAARAHAAGKGVQSLHTDALTGDPAEQLLGYARDHGINLIVLGRRGLGRIRGLLIGSVSLKVNSLAECPVLTVR